MPAQSTIAAPRADTGSSRAWTLYARMKNAAYSYPDTPAVAVHAAAGFNAQKPLQLVVFLHGYQGCVRVLMEKGAVGCKTESALQPGWGLAEHHDSADTNTLFVIPQLAFMKRDGNPGCFMNEGCFQGFLQELLSETLAEKLARPRTLKHIAGITLVAHSAGFETALAILQNGKVNSLVRALVLLDALYAGVDGFSRWFSETSAMSTRLISIYLRSGKTYRQNLLLHRRLERITGRQGVTLLTSGEIQPAICSFRAVIASGRGSHGRAPQNYLSTVLSALGSCPAGLAPPLR
ncbi:MAG: hypothetical protein JXA30_14360 [Deltaproteobacteria bacterium]|nr:hypothetical protein [Deltaproteobacteria bacterium]